MMGDVAEMGVSILDMKDGPLDTGEVSPISEEAIGDGTPTGVAGKSSSEGSQMGFQENS